MLYLLPYLHKKEICFKCVSAVKCFHRYHNIQRLVCTPLGLCVFFLTNNKSNSFILSETDGQTGITFSIYAMSLQTLDFSP